MLFKQSFHAGMRAGTISVTFRDWTRSQARPGNRYRFGDGEAVEVDTVALVPIASIDDGDARNAGFENAEAMVAMLRSKSARDWTPQSTVYKVSFHYAGKARATPSLPPGEVREKLARMDLKSASGSWTMKTLRLIASHPHTAAARLAAKLGRDKATFKVDVRKLKRLGLTRSFEVGYELTPLARQLLSTPLKRK